MGASNYPPGVSDSHPYFNPPGEIEVEVECDGDGPLVVPSYRVKTWLNQLEQDLEQVQLLEMSEANMNKVLAVGDWIRSLREEIDEIEDTADYDCTWTGTVELEEGQAEAEWDCPRCGVTQHADTIVEHEDPDRGWDERNEE
jgi:hypothetical protein